MSTVGATWLATAVGISGVIVLLFSVSTVKQLYKLPNSQDGNNVTGTTAALIDQDRYPSRKLKGALYLILLSLLLFLVKISVTLSTFITYANRPRYGICTFNTASCREGRRQEHEWSLQLGRLSYANVFFTITSKTMLFIVLIAMNRLLLPAKAIPKTKLLRASDVAQVVTLLALGLATWITAMSRRRNAGYSVTLQSIDTGVEDVGVFAADARFSNGIYIWAAFACWMVLMSVPVIAFLFRKIYHARKAGLPETEIHIAVVFAKWIVPVLLFVVGLFVAAVFLIIFRKDLSLSGTAAPAVMEIISSNYGDMAIYGVSLWALKRLVSLLQKNSVLHPMVAVAQV